MERVWLRGSCESVLRAKFLACPFAPVEHRTIRASAEDGSVEKEKKKARKINALGSCTKTFNLTRSRDTSLETLHSWARRLAFRYAYYTVPASLNAHENACGCCTLRSGSCGVLQARLSGDEWKSASRNTTRSASRMYLASVFSSVICIPWIPRWDIVNALPKQAPDCRSAERDSDLYRTICCFSCVTGHDFV